MNVIITAITVFSFICSLFLGRQGEVSSAAVSSAADAVTLVLSLMGGLCLWSGIMNVAKKAGICDGILKIILPIIRVIFPKLKKDSPAAKYIGMNITANLLGLGNAATPFGIEAMRELNKLNPYKNRPSDDMVSFVVINSSSLQLLPTTLSVIRSAHGSANPMDIVPAVLVTSMLSLFLGLMTARLISFAERKKKK